MRKRSPKPVQIKLLGGMDMLTKGTRATIKEWDDMVLLYGLTEDGDINTPGRVTFPKEDKDLCGEQIVIAYIRDVGEDILYECFLYDTMEILNFYVNNAMLTTGGENVCHG